MFLPTMQLEQNKIKYTKWSHSLYRIHSISFSFYFLKCSVSDFLFCFLAVYSLIAAIFCFNCFDWTDINDSSYKIIKKKANPIDKIYPFSLKVNVLLFIRLRMNVMKNCLMKKSFIFTLDGQGYGAFMYGIFGNYKNKKRDE